MRIPTAVSIAVLGAAGGFLYIHKRRGGELTVESFKRTARELLGQAEAEARELRARTEKRAHEVAAKLEEAAQTQTQTH